MNSTHRAVALALFTLAAGAQAEGDPAQGQRLFESRCIACHSIDSNRVGPALGGVFGRSAGAAPGYDYSAAVRGSGLVWTRQNLDKWLSDPEALVPGQKMGYSVSDAQDRADLIAYLRAVTSTARKNPSRTDYGSLRAGGVVRTRTRAASITATATIRTTVATGIRRPRMQGTPPSGAGQP